MPTTTKQLAKLAGVAEQTIRNYTDTYAELLSPQGRGEAGQRLFTDEDVQTVCSIATLRKEDVPPAEIIKRLQRGDVYIDATPHQATPSPQAPPNVTDAPQALMLVRGDLQRQINEIKRTQATLLRGALLWGVLLGAIGGLAFAAFVMWVMWLFG